MKISATAPRNTRISWKIYYGIVILIAVAMAVFVHHKAAGDYAEAVANYQVTSGTDANIAAHRVDEAFTQIYQNLRTISLLPSVRGIDRHGTNLSTSDRVSVQQIYNNLFSNVAVSEVYIVPKDLNPDSIDPVTNVPQVPILMFDSEISSDDSDSLDLGKPEEVEVYEYRLLHKQGAYLQQHFPTQSSVSGMNVPVVSGPEIITCDNSVFGKSRIDADRNGFILSVPFYGPDGALKGMISAITRTDTIKSLLPATDAALVNSGNGYVIDAQQAGQQQASAAAVADGTADTSLMFSTAIPLQLNDPQTRWIFWVGHPDATFFNGGDLRALRTFEDAGYGITGLLAAIALAGLWTIEHRLVRPVTRLADAVRRAAAAATEDANTVIPGTDRKDYLGEMARAVAKFHEGMCETDRLRATHAESRERAEQERAEALSTMADKVEHETRSAVAQLAANSKEMASDADIMAHSVASLGVNSHNVATGAAQSLATAQIVAGAAEEMRASIDEIGRQMRIAMTVTTKAVGASSHAQDTIRSLSEAVCRIGEVTKVIKTIASQTHLLALNATIEAARAGESGKGFAVVASEVKLLASQTAKATEEIGVQIQEILARTEIAVAAVAGIAKTIGEVESVSKCVAVAVEEQSAATAEITHNIVGTATAAQEVSQSIALVSSEAADTGRRADGVSTAARSTAEAVEELRRVLIQIVRTSSEFAERRKTPRFEINIAATLSLVGGSGTPGAVRARGYVEDCSEMGARFRGELPGARMGATVDLLIDDLNYPLRAAVRGVTDDVVQLEFDLPGGVAARFKSDFRSFTKNSRKLMVHVG